jgi:hypothetical protein
MSLYPGLEVNRVGLCVGYVGRVRESGQEERPARAWTGLEMLEPCPDQWELETEA